MGTSRGVQAQEVDVGYDRGYGMLDIKINLIFCNLVDFMNFTVGFYLLRKNFCMYMYVWSLCIAGPSRMMKKMIPNDMFYAHYPYRPDMEDSVILQILPAYLQLCY